MKLLQQGQSRLFLGRVALEVLLIAVSIAEPLSSSSPITIAEIEKLIYS
jgi:hypothetical protein